jgi:hypothetical protein
VRREPRFILGQLPKSLVDVQREQPSLVTQERLA